MNYQPGIQDPPIGGCLESTTPTIGGSGIYDPPYCRGSVLYDLLPIRGGVDSMTHPIGGGLGSTTPPPLFSSPRLVIINECQLVQDKFGWCIMQCVSLFVME